MHFIKFSDLIYYIYTAFIMVWVVGVIIIFGTAAILVSFFDKTGKLPHIVARAWGRSILFASRIHVTVKGFSNIDPDKSTVIWIVILVPSCPTICASISASIGKFICATYEQTID